MVKVTDFEIHGTVQSCCYTSFGLRNAGIRGFLIANDRAEVDVRFPTSLTGDGTDAMYVPSSKYTTPKRDPWSVHFAL